MSERRNIRVVVVDDSRIMRELLTSALSEDGDIAVVGAAAEPFEARDLIRETAPDVITLDVEMPKMDGLEFLRRIMALRPMPVVMVAGSTTAGAERTLSALEIGAVDFVAKPGNREEWEEFAVALREKVRAAAEVRFRGAAAAPDRRSAPRVANERRHHDHGTAARKRGRKSGAAHACRLVAIGASTGGVVAIDRLLAGLPDLMPPVLITQHMPPGFTARFAERLARTTGRDVAEASDGEVLLQGAIRLAPGNRHLRIERSGKQLVCKIGDDAPVSNHRPSVDELFASVATVCGERAIGVILTGMGSDGAKGLLQMRGAGARTFGEAESSCTVYGMPKAAMQIGAVCEEFQIDALSAHLSAQIASSRGVNGE